MTPLQLHLEMFEGLCFVRAYCLQAVCNLPVPRVSNWALLWLASLPFLVLPFSSCRTDTENNIRYHSFSILKFMLMSLFYKSKFSNLRWAGCRRLRSYVSALVPECRVHKSLCSVCKCCIFRVNVIFSAVG